MHFRAYKYGPARNGPMQIYRHFSNWVTWGVGSLLHLRTCLQDNPQMTVPDLQSSVFLPAAAILPGDPWSPWWGSLTTTCYPVIAKDQFKCFQGQLFLNFIPEIQNSDSVRNTVTISREKYKCRVCEKYLIEVISFDGMELDLSCCAEDLNPFLPG